MKHTNIEIKAKSTKEKQNKIREFLKSKSAEFKGTDIQIDTYFKTNDGRLKLREGNIENHLIFYKRENTKDSKESNILLYDSDPKSNLKSILINSLGELVVVKKSREIYFIDNVKFHLDSVEDLGEFVEIEAISENDEIPKEKLIEQCNNYKNKFEISEKDLIKDSYSDMLIRKNENLD